MKVLLPIQILKRKSLGFGTPINLWVKTGMRDFSGEILERLEKRKIIIKSDYIKKVIIKSSSNIYRYREWTLICLNCGMKQLLKIMF